MQTNGVDQILNHLAPDEGWRVEVEKAPDGDERGGRLVRLIRNRPPRSERLGVLKKRTTGQ